MQGSLRALAAACAAAVVVAGFGAGEASATPAIASVTPTTDLNNAYLLYGTGTSFSVDLADIYAIPLGSTAAGVPLTQNVTLSGGTGGGGGTGGDFYYTIIGQYSAGGASGISMALSPDVAAEIVVNDYEFNDYATESEANIYAALTSGDTAALRAFFQQEFDFTFTLGFSEPGEMVAFQPDGEYAGVALLTVPEPASLALLALGGVVIGLRRPRK